MKRIVSLLLAIVMVFSLIPMAAFAAGQTTISFKTSFSDEMTVGDTFTVTANLADNVNFLTMTLSLKWNEDVVKFTGFNKNTRGALETEVYTYTAAIANHELGIVTGSDAYGYDTNGKIFTANFEIIGTGELGIGLKDADATEFEMVDNNYAAINPVIDYSAIENLSVAAPESEGPAIPEGAPFTAITTDSGAIVDIDDRGTVSYSGYSTYNDVPHYHVYIPADANEVYVTHPIVEDPMVYNDYMTGNDVAGGYYADTADWSGGGFSFVYEAVTDGYNITIPTVGEIDTDWDNTPDQEVQFVADEYGYLHYAAAVERNDYTPICFFTFEYASEGGGEETTTYKINIAEGITGGTVSAENEAGETITEAAAGDEVHLNLQPDEGYMLQSFTVTDEQGGVGADNGVFVMPASDVTISATFTQSPPATYAINVSESQNGTVTAAVDGVAATAAAAGKTVTLTPDPADGYMLDTLTVMNGETPVEVTNNTFTMPAAAVTVSAAFKAIPAGYTVTMGTVAAPITAGETAEISVTVGNTDSTVVAYNAYQLELTYEEGLTFVSAEGSGVTNDSFEATHDKDTRTITIVGYGADKEMTAAPVKLTFSGSTVGTHAVTLVSANVDAAGKADVQDAPAATILQAVTNVQVNGFKVSLGEGLTAASLVAESGMDYTFMATDYSNYNYTITAKIGETNVNVTDNNGAYTIAGSDITGPITVTAVMTPKTYDVTIDGTKTENAATYNTDYTFTPVKDGYTVKNVTVTIGGTDYDGLTSENGTYKIKGADITDVIVVIIEWEAVTADSVAVEKGEGVSGNETATKNQDYEFSFTDTDKYEYNGLKVEIGEGDSKTDITAQVTYDETTGKHTIPGNLISGPITITVTRTEKNPVTVAVSEYLSIQEADGEGQNGTSIWLVTVSGVPEGSIAKYDGKNMYWSELTEVTEIDESTSEETKTTTGYGAFAYLVISDQELEAVKTEAESKVTVAALGENETPVAVDYSGNVNCTNKIDVNDAQLTYNMYNAVYSSFDEENGGVSMEKFLRADVNSDKKIDVNDAIAIVAEILAAK